MAEKLTLGQRQKRASFSAPVVHRPLVLPRNVADLSELAATSAVTAIWRLRGIVGTAYPLD